MIRQQVDIDEMQFGLIPEYGTTNTIFILRQLQEKYLAKKIALIILAFVDLEKSFDWVPRYVVQWALTELGVEEWFVKIVDSMYSNTQSRVRVNGIFSDDFNQDSVLVLQELLSREIRSGWSEELLYANDLAIVKHLRAWKGNWSLGKEHGSQNHWE